MTAPVDLPQLTALLERADSKGWGLDVDGDLTARVPTCWREGAWVNEQGRANAALVVAAIAALPALIAELTAARERLAGEEGRVMREALLWADEHADDQDMNHVNFRVGAGSRARTALTILERISHD